MIVEAAIFQYSCCIFFVKIFYILLHEIGKRGPSEKIVEKGDPRGPDRLREPELSKTGQMVTLFKQITLKFQMISNHTRKVSFHHYNVN